MSTPLWLNTTLYPFKSHFFETKAGKLHYVDEGSGDPIVFVHGNPTWSFQFRNLIIPLSKHFRCIAVDHIGFGLSDKPTDWTYLPKDHAQHLEELLESLDLQNITLVVGDWGGPIGLSYALRHPDRIKSLVINNTWLWSVKYNWYYEVFGRFVGGSIGRFLIRKRNFFARDIVRGVYGDKRKLTPKIHNHYLLPLARPEERKGTWIFPQQIIGSSPWLASLWEKIDVLRNKRILIAWGMKDIAFRKKELARWIVTFPHATIRRYPDAGHFVSDEKYEELVKEIERLNQD